MCTEQELAEHLHQKDVELPKIIVHTVCGHDIFLYFGSVEDAKCLRDLDSLNTLDGCHVLPKYISKCEFCEQKIRTDNITVVSITKGIDITKLYEHLSKYVIRDARISRNMLLGEWPTVDYWSK